MPCRTAVESQSAHRLRCRSGSPPVSITRCTCRRADRRDMRGRDRLVEISRLSALAFQMSHITQRQLQALCTLSARIGRLCSRPGHAAAGAPARASAGPHHQWTTSKPGSCSVICSTRAGRSSAPPAAARRRASRQHASTRRPRERRGAIDGSPTRGRPSIIVSRHIARVLRPPACRTGTSRERLKTMRSAGSPVGNAGRHLEPQQPRGAGGDQRARPSALSWRVRMRDSQLVEQIALAAQSRIAAQAPVDRHRQRRAHRRWRRRGTGWTKGTRPAGPGGDDALGRRRAEADAVDEHGVRR